MFGCFCNAACIHAGLLECLPFSNLSLLKPFWEQVPREMKIDTVVFH